jgi:transcriptional regulator with XRE-family HTH domain
VAFGTRVRAARERIGHKKPDGLAEAAGISVRMANAVELGEHVGPKTLRAVARAIGWREQDVFDYVAGTIRDLPEPQRPSLPIGGDLAPLDEVLSADFEGLRKIARLYAHFEARREGRNHDSVDEERFMLWALKTRADHTEREASIPPDRSSKSDVS